MIEMQAPRYIVRFGCIIVPGANKRLFYKPSDNLQRRNNVI